MCQYGFQVTLHPTETVVLCFSPAATQPAAVRFQKKRPRGRLADSLRVRRFPNSDMAVFDRSYSDMSNRIKLRQQC